MPLMIFRRWELDKSENPNQVTGVSAIANTAALGLIISPVEGYWLMERIEQSLTDNAFYWFDTDYYAAYLVRLFRMLKGENDIPILPPDARKKWDHPYEKVFKYWHNEEELAKIMYEMCEYHLIWNGDERDDHIPEFCDICYCVNPVEIHLLEYVRSKLGLTTPKVVHEILQTPLSLIPDSVKNIASESILENDELLRSIYGWIEDWSPSIIRLGQKTGRATHFDSRPAD